MVCPNCGCTDFKQAHKYFEEGYLVEYQLECLECKTIIGCWSYGYWEDREED